MSVDEKDALLVSLTGSKSQDNEEDVMVQGSGLSRGDKRRNGRLAHLRSLVPADNAILGIDLADTKQAVVVTDHDTTAVVLHHSDTLHSHGVDLSHSTPELTIGILRL